MEEVSWILVIFRSSAPIPRRMGCRTSCYGPHYTDRGTDVNTENVISVTKPDRPDCLVTAARPRAYQSLGRRDAHRYSHPNESIRVRCAEGGSRPRAWHSRLSLIWTRALRSAARAPRCGPCAASRGARTRGFDSPPIQV